MSRSLQQNKRLEHETEAQSITYLGSDGYGERGEGYRRAHDRIYTLWNNGHMMPHAKRPHTLGQSINRMCVITTNKRVQDMRHGNHRGGPLPVHPIITHWQPFGIYVLRHKDKVSAHEDSELRTGQGQGHDKTVLSIGAIIGEYSRNLPQNKVRKHIANKIA